MRTTTPEDFEMIDSSVIGDNDKALSRLSELENACYACTRNFQRNSIATKIFSQHVINTHIADSDPPNQTIIIKSKMEKKKSRKMKKLMRTEKLSTTETRTLRMIRRKAPLMLRTKKKKARMRMKKTKNIQTM